MSVVGQRIKQERERRGVSQYRLSKLSGVSQPTISAIEAADQTRSPAVDTVEKIARALGCQVGDLMGEAAPGVKEYTQDIRQLLEIVQRLNSLGVQKVIDYAADLAENEKYREEASAASSAG